MSDFSCFLKKNARPIDAVKYVASDRFTDKDGKPVAWTLKAVSTDMDEKIRRDCTKYVTVGKRGQSMPKLDVDAYAAKLSAACTVEPNLNSAELQDDYGVKCAEDLLKAMLNAGEYNEYKTKVLEINGFNLSMDEMIEDAKN